MGDLTRTLLVLLLLPLSWAAAREPVLIAVDEGGAAGRVGAPVSMDIDLATVFDGNVEPDRLQIVELNTRPNMPPPADAVVQFIPCPIVPTPKGILIIVTCMVLLR